MYSPSEEKEKILSNAAAYDDLETIKRFIEKEGVPLAEKLNCYEDELLHIAARNGSLNTIKYLIQKDSSVLSHLDAQGYTILDIAIEEGNLELVKYLAENCNADLHEPNRRNLRCSAIHSAVEFGHSNILKYLIENRNMDVNLPTHDTQGEPSLFLAVKYQHRDIIEYLVEEVKTNLTIVNNRGENVLYVALRKNDISFMKYLMDKKKVKFDVNWKNEMGETLVHIAVALNRFSILEYLVGVKHADVNIPEMWKNLTPLHYAASRNNFEICTYLVEHGANARWKDTSGDLPAKKATEERVMRYLTENSVRNRRSINLGTPFHSMLLPMTPHYDYEYRQFGEYLSQHIGRLRGEIAISLSNNNITQFQNFLTVAMSVVKHKTNK